MIDILKILFENNTYDKRGASGFAFSNSLAYLKIFSSLQLRIMINLQLYKSYYDQMVSQFRMDNNLKIIFLTTRKKADRISNIQQIHDQSSLIGTD